LTLTIIKEDVPDSMIGSRANSVHTS